MNNFNSLSKNGVLFNSILKKSIFWLQDTDGILIKYIILYTLKLIFFDPVNRGFLATRSIQFAIL